MNQAKKVEKIMEILDNLYPQATCALSFETPFQLLVSVRLSAQCTDARVNMVTPALFARFPDAQSFAEADLCEIEDLIRSCGFYHDKARSIQEFSAIIAEKYHGEPPRTLEELTALPGVGRKTANLILYEVYGIPGLVIDTHAKRLSKRLGLTASDDPIKVERDLEPIVPKAKQTIFCHQLIYHGRAVCKAQKPLCENCALRTLCGYGKQVAGRV